MQKAVQPKVNMEKNQNGRERTPLFSAFSRPKGSWGRSRLRVAKIAPML